MSVKVNPNKEIADLVKQGLKETGGYCPCRRERTEDTKCMCKEFRDQIADPDFEGFCHCQLYYKSKDWATRWTALGRWATAPRRNTDASPARRPS